MDAAQALADLTAVSSQIEGAVLADAGGELVASTFADGEVGERVAERAAALVAAAEARGGAAPGVELSSVVAETPDGGVFVVRGGDRLVGAVTGAEPTVGLVLYDLKTCLRLAEEGEGQADVHAAEGRRAEGAGDA
jgi:predicted regulator of Ras-like GTPase activity (Roadblock/LC7/MglB family)